MDNTWDFYSQDVGSIPARPATGFQLEEPFKSVYKKGYLRSKDKDGRKRIDLFNSNTDRTTISYARYLMSVKLGRFLEEHEEVDHIDTDRTNDNIDNLQILTKPVHAIKSANERRGRNIAELVCPQCGVVFEREVRNIKKGTVPKCSRRCNGLSLRNKPV